jgi:hypothetical protein
VRIFVGLFLLTLGVGVALAFWADLSDVRSVHRRQREAAGVRADSEKAAADRKQREAIDRYHRELGVRLIDWAGTSPHLAPTTKAVGEWYPEDRAVLQMLAGARLGPDATLTLPSGRVLNGEDAQRIVRSIDGARRAAGRRP